MVKLVEFVNARETPPADASSDLNAGEACTKLFLFTFMHLYLGIIPT